MKLFPFYIQRKIIQIFCFWLHLSEIISVEKKLFDNNFLLYYSRSAYKMLLILSKEIVYLRFRCSKVLCFSNSELIRTFAILMKWIKGIFESLIFYWSPLSLLILSTGLFLLLFNMWFIRIVISSAQKLSTCLISQ